MQPTNIIDDLRLLQAPQPLPMFWWVLIVLAFAGLFSLLLWRRASARRAAPSPAAIQAATEDALAELEKLRAMIAGESRASTPSPSRALSAATSSGDSGIRAPWRSTEEFLLEAQKSTRLGEQFRAPLASFWLPVIFSNLRAPRPRCPNSNRSTPPRSGS